MDLPTVLGPGAQQEGAGYLWHTQGAPTPLPASLQVGIQDPASAMPQGAACPALAASWQLTAIQADPAASNAP